MAAAEHKAPERASAYRIVRQLGAGGFGAVYDGWHGSRERRAASTTLYAELASRPELAQRFLKLGAADHG